MSTVNRFKRLIDSDAVRRAELSAPKHRAERERGRDRRNIRRALRRLGYHEAYVEKETAKLSALAPRYRTAALVKLRSRLGIRPALVA
jgi:hypothetical protein